MIYDTVISQTSTYEEFVKTFYSNYKSLQDWNKMFNKFKLQKIIRYNNQNRSYIAIYTKIL